MDETPPQSPADTLPDDCSRREAVALYYARCRAIASQIEELRRLRQKIRDRWGRPPAWPRW